MKCNTVTLILAAIMFSSFASAQNECPSGNFVPSWGKFTDSSGVIHQTVCIDINGKWTLPLVNSISLSTLTLSSITTGGGVVSIPSTTDTFAVLNFSQTFTQKRITPRQSTIVDATSITVNSDTTDIATQINTQGSGTLTIAAPTGTPTDGQKLVIRIKSTNSQTYSFNAAFSFSTTNIAPVTLAAGKTDYIGAMWNATNSKWDVVAIDQGH